MLVFTHFHVLFHLFLLLALCVNRVSVIERTFVLSEKLNDPPLATEDLNPDIFSHCLFSICKLHLVMRPLIFRIDTWFFSSLQNIMTSSLCGLTLLTSMLQMGESFDSCQLFKINGTLIFYLININGWIWLKAGSYFRPFL